MKYLAILTLFVFACTPQKPLDADGIIAEAIETHGLGQITNKKIEFDFRDKHYSVLRESDKYTYTRSFQDSLGYVEDILVNSSDFTRLIDGTELEVDSVWTGKYSNSVNSVLYFIQLPLTLTDPAALKDYKGISKINGKEYHLIEIRFTEEDGGKDFEDVFLYWFDATTFSMDYLAYSYITDDGGVRFREAFNKRKVGGVVFQDYINYKPEDKLTPIEEMSVLFEKGELVELSRIENVNVSVK
ncbi:MAG: DUF6503 family protein [Cyclobacteriaceae bacterium]